LALRCNKDAADKLSLAASAKPAVAAAVDDEEGVEPDPVVLDQDEVDFLSWTPKQLPAFVVMGIIMHQTDFWMNTLVKGTHFPVIVSLFALAESGEPQCGMSRADLIRDGISNRSPKRRDFDTDSFFEHPAMKCATISMEQMAASIKVDSMRSQRQSSIAAMEKMLGFKSLSEGRRVQVEVRHVLFFHKLCGQAKLLELLAEEANLPPEEVDVDELV
jgi:hypothetical protein